MSQWRYNNGINVDMYGIKKQREENEKLHVYVNTMLKCFFSDAFSDKEVLFNNKSLKHEDPREDAGGLSREYVLLIPSVS